MRTDTTDWVLRHVETATAPVAPRSPRRSPRDLWRAAPEAAIGRPVALVHNDDVIELDVSSRTIPLHLTDEELAERRAGTTAPPTPATGGYTRLYVDHVTQANHGADLDFLVGARGHTIPRDSH